MKLSSLVFASVVGATLFAAAGSASADRWYPRERVVVRPYARPYVAPVYVRPRVVVEPIAPVVVAPPVITAPVVVERPVVVRPRFYYSRPLVVRRGWYR
jgi:hypothetical protein